MNCDETLTQMLQDPFAFIDLTGTLHHINLTGDFSELEHLTDDQISQVVNMIATGAINPRSALALHLEKLLENRHG